MTSASWRPPVVGARLPKVVVLVVRLVAEGWTTKQIGRTLGISYRTAETHRREAMRKLGIHSTAALVRYAVRNGLTEA